MIRKVSEEKEQTSSSFIAKLRLYSITRGDEIGGNKKAKWLVTIWDYAYPTGIHLASFVCDLKISRIQSKLDKYDAPQ